MERKDWCNRDRLVMSCGHGSALLYASLFYMLDEYSIDDLKSFRKIASSTPGHPEYDLSHRIEMTTGALGQGFATSVGMEKYLEATFNRKKNTVFDYNIYCICSDGDLMEGVSYEAASMAGNLGLDNLIVLYDANNITADGDISKTFDDNITDRFTSMNWNVIKVRNSESVSEITSAIEKAKKSNKPTNIRMSLKGTSPFTYSENDRNGILEFIKGGTSDYYRDWYSEYEMYLANATDSERDKINLVIENEGISLDIDAVVDASKIFEDKPMRDINYQIMNVIGTFIPNYMGGSADLFCSTKTYLKGKREFSYDDYGGRNINADYMKPEIRMSAMMDLPVTYIFTHDSVRVGPDGITHQPVEQLGMLRSIPNFSVYRPCDYKELIGSWTNILREGKPCALVLPRGHLETMKHTNSEKVSRGAYIISEVRTRLDIIIIATGSEVGLAMKIKEELLKNYIEARVVTMPNLNLFLKQDKDYQEQVFPTGYRRMVIELSNDANWYRFISSDEDFVGIDTFGKSGSEEEILSFFELDIQDLVIKIKNNL